MTPDDAFLRAIIDNPEDDTPRLIYADWLEEHGRPERAEFIRVACTLAKLAEDDPQHQELRPRHRDLLKEHEREWAGPLAGLVEHWWFIRGFIEYIDIHTATLLRQAEAVFGSAPVRHVRLLQAEGLTGGLAVCSQLGHVTGLNLYGNSIGDAGLRELLSSPYRKRPSTHLRLLRQLILGGTGISLAGLHDLLAHCQLMPDLDDLGLAGNHLGDQAVEALAASPLAGRLRRLGLSYCLGPAGVRALASSPSFEQLQSLHLAGCRAGDAECEILAASATLPMLTRLSIGWGFQHPSRMTPAGIEALVHSPNLSRLRHLDLEGSAIGDAGVEVLASAGGLRELRWLGLGRNGIGVRGVRALLRSPFWPTLQGLFLAGNPIGDAGASALLAAPVPKGLHPLFLHHCEISEPLQQALRERFGDRVSV